MRWSPGACAGVRRVTAPRHKSRRFSRRSRICAGESALTRAAASSSASGSRRAGRQICAAIAYSSATSGATLAPAAGRSRHPPRLASGDTAYSCSPATCSASRLVTSSSRFGTFGEERGDPGSPPRSRARSCRAGRASRCRRYGRRARSRADDLADGLEHESRVAERRERHPPDAVREPIGEHRAPPGRASRVFPVPPGPVSVSRRRSSRQEAHTSTELLLATEERVCGHREVRARYSVSERRERASPSWYTRSGAERSLKRCSPRSSESASTRAAVEARDQHLTTVTGSGDARRAVDVIADVALLRRGAASPCAGRPGRGSGRT